MEGTLEFLGGCPRLTDRPAIAQIVPSRAIPATPREPVVAEVFPIAAGYWLVTSIEVMYLGCLKPSLVVILSRIGAPNFGSIGRSA